MKSVIKNKKQAYIVLATVLSLNAVSLNALSCSSENRYCAEIVELAKSGQYAAAAKKSAVVGIILSLAAGVTYASVSSFSNKIEHAEKVEKLTEILTQLEQNGALKPNSTHLIISTIRNEASSEQLSMVIEGSLVDPNNEESLNKVTEALKSFNSEN